MASIGGLKLTSTELEKMNKPLSLDLTAYFSTLQEAIIKTINKKKTPDQIIAEINQLMFPTSDNKEVMKDDRPIDFIDFHGINIGIENPKGSVRTGVDPDGNEWSIDMNFDYGFIKNANAIDGDSLDAYIGDDPESEKVFVINQQDPNTGEFDEYKVMFGFATQQKAVAGYLSQYDSPLFFGGVTEETIDKFKIDTDVAKAGKKYDVGDTKTRPDGTVWEKTGTYSWKKVSAGGGAPQSSTGAGASTPDKKKPATKKPSKDDDTTDPKYMSAEDAGKIIDSNGKKGFWNLTKSGLNNWLKSEGVDDPSVLTHADKKKLLETIVDTNKENDKTENTIAPKAFKPFSNQNLSSPVEPYMLKSMYDNAQPMQGRHWGSASTHNDVALGVAFTSGTNWRPINKMEDGKLVDYNQMLGADGRNNGSILNGMKLRKYAQDRMKDHDRTEVPNFHRGMTLDQDSFNQLMSGESDTIELTGCTAFSSYEEIAVRYSKSSWTKGFGSGRTSVRIILERDDHVDDSIGMWHESFRSSSLDPKPAFELLSGLEAIRVVSVGGAKKSVTQPETFKKRAKAIANDMDTVIDGEFESEKRTIKYQGEKLQEMEDGTYDYPSWYDDAKKEQSKRYTKERIEVAEKFVENYPTAKKTYNQIVSEEYDYLGKLAGSDHYESWDRGLRDLEDYDKGDITMREMLDYEGSSDMGSPYNIFATNSWAKPNDTFKNPPDKIADMTIKEYRHFTRTMSHYDSSVASGKRFKNQFRQKGSAGVTILHCVAGRGKKAIQGNSDESMEDDK